MKKGSVFKSELAEEYRMSMGQLSYLLNVRYFEHLKTFGYHKYMKLLSPKIVAEFVKIWGYSDEFLKDENE